MLRAEVPTLHVLPPLTQLIRLWVANGNPNLAFATHLSLNLLHYVFANGGPTCYPLSLDSLDYMLQTEVQTLYVLLPHTPSRSIY